MAQTQVGQTGRAETVTMAVVKEVAKREGVDPLELHPPLHDAIDTDALEALFADSISGEQRDGVSLTFKYCGYEIAITGNREIQVRNA